MTDPHRGDISADGRRAEDRGVAENVNLIATTLDRFIRWGRRVRWLVVAVVGSIVSVFTMINAYASWAGAQHSSPAQEIRRVDLRVDSLSITIGRVDSTVQVMRLATDSLLQGYGRNFDLLLRISCRGLEFRDLLEQCRAVGANR